MKCAIPKCGKEIDTQNEEFEEIGQIEFAHSKCVEKDLERETRIKTEKDDEATS
jgi:hypothetical protein